MKLVLLFCCCITYIWIASGQSTYDLSLVVTNEAISEIMESYVALLIKSSRDSPLSATVSTSEAKVSWEDLSIANLTHDALIIDFIASTQKIQLQLNNLALQSNIFSFSLESGIFSCDGLALFTLNDWDISLSVQMVNNESPNVINELSANTVNISDCDLKLDIKSDSLKIVKPANIFDFQYSLNDGVCDGFFNSGAVKNLFVSQINSYLENQLTKDLTVLLQETVSYLQSQTQTVDIYVGDEEDTILICYYNVTVLTETQLLIAANIYNNVTVDFNSNTNSNGALFDIAEEGDGGSGLLALEVTIIVFVSIFALIGLVCSIRYRCYYKQILKLKQKCQNRATSGTLN